MDDKQKQIAEMAKDLEEARYYAMATVGSLNSGFGGWYGAYMYKKGYRKQSDTAREIFQKLIYNITANNTNDGYLSESIDYSSTIDDIKELAAQYGVEVEE